MVVIHKIYYDDSAIIKSEGDYMFFAVDTLKSGININNKLEINGIVYFVIPSINDIININFSLYDDSANKYVTTGRYYVDYLNNRSNTFYFTKEIENVNSVFYISILYANKKGELKVIKHTPPVQYRGAKKLTN